VYVLKKISWKPVRLVTQPAKIVPLERLSIVGLVLELVVDVRFNPLVQDDPVRVL
jgi:hypothetical protein